MTNSFWSTRPYGTDVTTGNRSDATGPVPCRGKTAVMFDDSELGVARAKQICAGCPMEAKVACLAGALERREPAGVWGGASTVDRRRIRRARRAAA